MPKPEVCPLSGRFWVNTLAQGVLLLFTQWRGGHFTTELVPPQYVMFVLTMFSVCLFFLTVLTLFSSVVFLSLVNKLQNLVG